MPITPQFDAGDRRLAVEMKRFWGAFVNSGNPEVRGQARWPAYDVTDRILSLRPAGRSRLLSERAYRREHRCAFWDTLPPAA